MPQLPVSLSTFRPVFGHEDEENQIKHKLGAVIDVVADFGATGNNTDDDTTAIQNAIANLSDGDTLIFPRPSTAYKISDTLLFDSQKNIKIHFQGARNDIQWAGDATSPLFHLRGCRDFEIRGIKAQSTASTPLAEGFRVETLSGQTSTNHRFDDVVFNGTTNGLDYGWRFITGTGGDSNNDLCKFVNCHVLNYAEAAWSFEHSQSKAHNLYHCSWNSNSNGKYGVTTALGTSTQGGSFQAMDCFGGFSTVADFYVGAANDGIKVRGGNFEGSNRLYLDASAASSRHSVHLIGVDWAAANIDADTKAVIYKRRGPFVMIGCNVGANSVNTVTLDVTSSSAEVAAVAIGNTIRTDSSTPFTGDWSFRAANLLDDGNNRTVIEDMWAGDKAGISFFDNTVQSQAAANADTSGATLGQLETEVNELKQLLRDYGLMAT